MVPANPAAPFLRPAIHLAGRLALWCLLLALVVGGDAIAAEPNFPALTGRIVDNANLLTPEDRAAIEAELAALEQKSSDQIAVVTVPSLEGFAIEDYGVRLGRYWGIGQKGKDNGVILIVAPNERKVRIEVGRGLEPQLTDLMSNLIIQNAMLPAFRRGDFSGGIRAGVRDIKDVVLGDTEAVRQRAKGMGEGQGPDAMALLILAIWIGIFLYITWVQTQHARQMPHNMGRAGRRGRRYRDGGIVIIPGGAGDWSGGSWGGGGGGGWSGGGGGFGGGGASGDW